MKFFQENEDNSEDGKFEKIIKENENDKYKAIYADRAIITYEKGENLQNVVVDNYGIVLEDVAEVKLDKQFENEDGTIGWYIIYNTIDGAQIMAYSYGDNQIGELKGKTTILEHSVDGGVIYGDD